MSQKEITPLNVENSVETVEKSTETPESVTTPNYEELYKQASKSVAELTAERDSLLNENTELRSAKEAAITESAKTKELNYTLARQLNIQQDVKRNPEDILADMFLKKE